MAEENRKKHHRGRKKKKGGSNIVSNIILVIAIVVFAVSAYKLYGIFSEYNKGDKEYQKIQDLVINTDKKDDTKEETFSVDFEKLLEMNSDVVGWIRFDEPSEINYPVVQGRDNEEYKERIERKPLLRTFCLDLDKSFYCRSLILNSYPSTFL